jgi:hypothetical protein
VDYHQRALLATLTRMAEGRLAFDTIPKRLALKSRDRLKYLIKVLDFHYTREYCPVIGSLETLRSGAAGV